MIVGGNFGVTGAKNALVPHPDGTHRTMYSLECPESWFEDFGEGRLVNGRAQVALDPDFAAVVQGQNYRVFLTPEGDTNGLYVSAKSRPASKCARPRAGRARWSSAIGWSPSARISRGRGWIGSRYPRRRRYPHAVWGPQPTLAGCGTYAQPAPPGAPPRPAAPPAH